MKHHALKSLVTLAIILALLLIPYHSMGPEFYGPPSPQPQNLLVCLIVAVILVIVVVVIVKGLCKMCDHLPPPGESPATNAPPSSDPYPAICIEMPATTSGGLMVFQSQEPGQAWKDELKFRFIDLVTNVAAVVCDSNGLPLVTNTFAVTNMPDGQRCSTADLSSYINVSNSPAKLFRLVSVQ